MRAETSDSSWDPAVLATEDGERLASVHLPPLDPTVSPGGAGSFAVVLVPGFSGSTETPAVRSVTSDLRESVRRAGFVVVTMRGHGQSSGYSTLGDREAIDVDAAVAEARRLGYPTVLTLGWSMGATCVLRHAALVGETVHGVPLRCGPDAVATVSAVSRWEVRDTVPMRRLHRLIESRLGRAIAKRFFGVRIDPAGSWAETPMSPVEAVARLDVPLLLVHGDNDHYYGWEHAKALAAAAGPDARLWLVDGLGHAEQAAARPDVPALLAALGRALGEMAEGRPAPDWPRGADVDAQRGTSERTEP